ncbi:MAG: hypothetical protein ACI91G_000780 [Gammaproteobacteria bacterium]|jgi:hypothetical protein
MTETTQSETPAKAQMKYPDAEMADKVIEGMRAAHLHHANLTNLVDQKANILLGASLVLVSAIQAWIGNGNPVNLAMMVLMFTAGLTTIFALLTVMPRVVPSTGTVPMKNPFFFGSFAGLTEEEYVAAIDEQVSTTADTREYLSRSMYNMGVVLVSKYKSLRRSYLALGVGIITSAVLFAVEFATTTFGR